MVADFVSHLTLIVAVVAVYFVFSSGVDAMLPPPAGKERSFSGWWYRFMQNLAANASRAMAAKYPQLAHPPVESAALIATKTDTHTTTEQVAVTDGKGN